MFYTETGTFGAITEAYYGKTKELQTIEQELEKVIAAINENSSNMEKGIILKRGIKSVANSDSVRIIEKQFEKMFKLSKFYLALYTAVPTGVPILGRQEYNAYTLGKGFNYFKKKVSKNRVDSVDMVIGVNVDIGLVRLAGLTAPELLAIILHEVGHNMSASITSFISMCPIILSPLTGISLVSSTISGVISGIYSELMGAPIANMNKIIERGLESIPFVYTLFQSFNDAFMNFAGLLQQTGINLFNIARINPLSIISPRNIFGYTEEKYADSFVSSYGYGTELASALNKTELMSNVKSVEILRKIPGINAITNLFSTSFSAISAIADPHPATPVRIMSQLKKLKKDLDDPNLDRRVRKDLEENIKELENFIEHDYLDYKSNENKRRVFTWMYNNLVIKVFKGKVDPRELFNAFKIEE